MKKYFVSCLVILLAVLMIGCTNVSIARISSSEVEIEVKIYPFPQWRQDYALEVSLPEAEVACYRYDKQAEFISIRKVPVRTYLDSQSSRIGYAVLFVCE